MLLVGGILVFDHKDGGGLFYCEKRDERRGGIDDLDGAESCGTEIFKIPFDRIRNEDSANRFVFLSNFFIGNAASSLEIMIHGDGKIAWEHFIRENETSSWLQSGIYVAKVLIAPFENEMEGPIGHHHIEGSVLGRKRGRTYDRGVRERFRNHILRRLDAENVRKTNVPHPFESMSDGTPDVEDFRIRRKAPSGYVNAQFDNFLIIGNVLFRMFVEGFGYRSVEFPLPFCHISISLRMRFSN